MKTTITCFIAVLLTAVTASAASVTVTDEGTASYGDASGFLIDFDATITLAVDWTPDLVDGTTYFLDSVSMRYGGAQANTSPKYLGVYTGFGGGVLSGFLGVSESAIDFTSVAAGDWQQYTFNGIQVTADSTVGSGSGLLYFVYQTGTSELAGLETTVSTRRIDGFPGDPDPSTVLSYYSSILAFGSVQQWRSPEYQASLTAVPEPTVAAFLGLSVAALLCSRRRPVI